MVLQWLVPYHMTGDSEAAVESLVELLEDTYTDVLGNPSADEIQTQLEAWSSFWEDGAGAQMHPLPCTPLETLECVDTTCYPIVGKALQILATLPCSTR